LARGRSLLALAVAVSGFAIPTSAQSDGHSYLRMKIAGHQLTNIVVAERYQGWLGIIGVSAMVIQPSQNGGTSSRDAGADGTAIKTKKETARWSALPAVFRLGRVDAGKIRFGAGDDGGLDPLVDAQKKKSLIPSADLDIYDESSGVIGKYRLKGIRVLSLEDFKAYACAMYEITMSFQSAEKIHP
jgi:hypothetical protein